MYMKDWIFKLNDFLVLNDKENLDNPGNVSRSEMELKVRDELARFNQRQLN